VAAGSPARTTEPPAPSLRIVSQPPGPHDLRRPRRWSARARRVSRSSAGASPSREPQVAADRTRRSPRGSLGLCAANIAQRGAARQPITVWSRRMSVESGDQVASVLYATSLSHSGSGLDVWLCGFAPRRSPPRFSFAPATTLLLEVQAWVTLSGLRPGLEVLCAQRAYSDWRKPLDRIPNLGVHCFRGQTARKGAVGISPW
jgi:hypothetical protein